LIYGHSHQIEAEKDGKKADPGHDEPESLHPMDTPPVKQEPQCYHPGPVNDKSSADNSCTHGQAHPTDNGAGVRSQDKHKAKKSHTDKYACCSLAVRYGWSIWVHKETPFHQRNVYIVDTIVVVQRFPPEEVTSARQEICRSTRKRTVQ
jgi:hypothetical protein